MQNDAMERASTLKRQISLLQPWIQKEIDNAENDPDNFAQNFVAKANQAQLLSLREELKKLLVGREKETIDVRLTGDNVGYGTAPAQSVGHFLSGLQGVIERIGQKMIHGPKNGGKVPTEIKYLTQLRLENISTGSFRMSLSGNLPDSGMFSTDPEIHNDNLLTKSIVAFFDALQSNEPIDEISALGAATVTSFKEFFSSIIEENIEIETSWVGLEGEIRNWKGHRHCIAELSSQLDQLDDPVAENIAMRGRFSLLDVDKNRFSFHTEGDDVIRGMFTEDAKTVMRSINVDIFEEKDYLALFVKEVVKNKITLRERTIWTLIDVRSA